MMIPRRTCAKQQQRIEDVSWEVGGWIGDVDVLLL